MAIVYSVIAAGVYGTSDYFGGLATRRLSVLTVMFWVHLIGLVAVGLATPFLADQLLGRDIALGVVAGLVGLAGLLMFYWALSVGPMGVVAPIAGLLTALVAVGWDLKSPDEPVTALTALGLVLGLVAVVTTSWPEAGDGAATKVSAKVLAASVAGGACFGTLLLIYDATSEAGAPWPVVSSRLATTVLLGGALALAPRVSADASAAKVPVVVAGLGDTFANVMLLAASGAAVTARQLSVVAVVSGLYPAATILWARFHLGEQLGWVRRFGMVCALTAIVVMSVS